MSTGAFNEGSVARRRSSLGLLCSYIRRRYGGRHVISETRNTLLREAVCEGAYVLLGMTSSLGDDGEALQMFIHCLVEAPNADIVQRDMMYDMRFSSSRAS